MSAEKTLELAHHVLHAKLFQDHDEEDVSEHEDLMQSIWLSMTDLNLSSALGCPKNVFSPNFRVSRLLLEAGASAKYTTGHLHNAPLLSLFTDRNHEEMVSLLVEFGADVNGTNTEGVTPLMFAAIRGNLDISRSLLEAGAVINKTDKSEKCALVYAAQFGHLNLIEYLVSSDWPAHKKKDLGLVEAAQQALITAAMAGRFQVGYEMIHKRKT